ncbi:hypothetical protein GCM10009081_33690 [Brevundimonas nasdae]
MNVIRTLTPTSWLLVGVLVAFLLFGAFCSYRGVQGRQEVRAGQTLAEGRTGAAQDASAVRDRSDARNDQISNAVKEGTADVRQAPDRSAANLAARRGVCRINPSAGPDCRLLLTDPARVD